MVIALTSKMFYFSSRRTSRMYPYNVGVLSEVAKTKAMKAFLYIFVNDFNEFFYGFTSTEGFFLYFFVVFHF